MSFQDLSRRGSSNGGVTSGGPSNAPRRSNGAPPPRGLDGAVDAIAENLRQFSHNVSLLERLADHLAGAPRASEELLRQIAAQQDVGRARAAHTKLRKDFDRVQGTLQVAMQEEAINDAILREREEEIREINQNVHKRAQQQRCELHHRASAFLEQSAGAHEQRQQQQQHAPSLRSHEALRFFKTSLQ
ncbi:hypothetical protein JL721_13086 [Aureococcus anophagefferens]|nr:hypothetical protein JL721_13086 [Aureococcus anophagefferens]